jgi:hypothetical protein
LFATLARRFISVAVKGLKARVGSPTGVGISTSTTVLERRAGASSHTPHIVIYSVKYSTGYGKSRGKLVPAGM